MLGLVVLPGNSADITDNYTTGDTLTATMMNNIKGAVNDNDARITTNSQSVTTLQTDVGTLQTNVSVVQDQLGGADDFGFPCLLTFPGGIPDCLQELATIASTVRSVTVDVTAYGFLVASFSGTYSISHTNGTSSNLCCELSTLESGPGTACVGIVLALVEGDSYRRIFLNAALPSGL